MNIKEIGAAVGRIIKEEVSALRKELSGIAHEVEQIKDRDAEGEAIKSFVAEFEKALHEQ